MIFWSLSIRVGSRQKHRFFRGAFVAESLKVLSQSESRKQNRTAVRQFLNTFLIS